MAGNSGPVMGIFRRQDMAVPQPASDKLFGVRLKIKRAEEKIRDLERAVRAFLDSEPYKVRSKNDPQTGYVLYKVVSVQDVPADIPFDAGESLHHLQSASTIWPSNSSSSGRDTIRRMNERSLFPSLMTPRNT